MQEAGRGERARLQGAGRGKGKVLRVQGAQFCRPDEVELELHVYAGDPPKVSTVTNQKM